MCSPRSQLAYIATYRQPSCHLATMRFWSHPSRGHRWPQLCTQGPTLDARLGEFDDAVGGFNRYGELGGAATEIDSVVQAKASDYTCDTRIRVAYRELHE